MKTAIEMMTDLEYSKEQYLESRRLMGLKTTNFENLIKAIGFCFLYCHENMRDKFENLLVEVTRRKLYMDIGI